MKNQFKDYTKKDLLWEIAYNKSEIKYGKQALEANLKELQQTIQATMKDNADILACIAEHKAGIKLFKREVAKRTRK